MLSAVKRVEDLLTELGFADKVTRVTENVWTLSKGSATIQIIAAPKFVVATARVADGLPVEGHEDFLRMLLVANVTMLGAFFTLEEDDSIRINQVLPIDWLDSEELAFVVGNVAKRADKWNDRLGAAWRNGTLDGSLLSDEELEPTKLVTRPGE